MDSGEDCDSLDGSQYRAQSVLKKPIRKNAGEKVQECKFANNADSGDDFTFEFTFDDESSENEVTRKRRILPQISLPTRNSAKYSKKTKEKASSSNKRWDARQERRKKVLKITQYNEENAVNNSGSSQQFPSTSENYSGILSAINSDFSELLDGVPLVNIFAGQSSLQALLERVTENVQLHTLVYFIQERWAIQKRRESGALRPWTSNPILANERFCCIRREDDKTSKYMMTLFKDKDPLTDDAYLFNLWFHRYLSNIPAIQTMGYVHSLQQVQMQLYEWIDDGFKFRPNCFISSASDRCILEAVEANWNYSQQNSRRIFGGQIVSDFDSSSRGYGIFGDDQDYLLDTLVLQNCAPRIPALSKRQFYERVKKDLKLCGQFHAFQDSNDAVMYGAIADDPYFCVSGPGAQTGLALLELPPSEEAVVGLTEILNQTIRRLKGNSEGENHIQTLPQMRVIDTEHVLCEFQKYCSAMLFSKYMQK
ncbi:hypothetical protein HDU82_002135 [Entophlyctis luteolus]|nr:hypothetical protein HDU82_002135 [Entophlyctis luteolus]